MAITRKEVEKVALLGRLLLSEEELDTMTSQMGDILGYMELLGELDTEQVEPMAHALDVANVFREDGWGPVWIAARRWPTPPSGTPSVIWFPPCLASEPRLRPRDRHPPTR